jgi:hypothetical protein
MTRAAFVSAIAFAVAACGPAPAPPYSDVTFYWRFQDMNGNLYGDWTAAYPGCGIANVDHVRVSYTGPAGYETFTAPCTVNGVPGAMPPAPLPTGSYAWTLEGMRQGLAVYYAEGVSDFVNFPSFYLTLPAVYANMDLWYDFPLGGSCVGVSEILFELDNLDANLVEYSSANAFVGCGAPFGFTMPSIPSPNNYGFRFVEAVDPVSRVLYQACGGVAYPPQAPIWHTGSEPASTAHLVGICP